MSKKFNLTQEVKYYSVERGSVFAHGFFKDFNFFEPLRITLPEESYRHWSIKQVNAAEQIAVLNQNAANSETLPLAAAFELWEFELRRFVFAGNFCSSDCFVPGCMQ